MIRLIVGGLLGYGLAKISRPILPAASSSQIEVGAQGVDLRYWLAKEALRQSEITSGFESSALTATIGLATTILGWLVPAATAAGIAAITARKPEWRFAADVVLVGFGLTVSICIFVILPIHVKSAAFDAPQLLNSGLTTELEHLESMALGQFEASQKRRTKLVLLRRAVALAWFLFFATPGFAVVALTEYPLIFLTSV
jgi:hypothetical protein